MLNKWDPHRKETGVKFDCRCHSAPDWIRMSGNAAAAGEEIVDKTAETSVTSFDVREGQKDENWRHMNRIERKGACYWDNQQEREWDRNAIQQAWLLREEGAIPKLAGSLRTEEGQR